ncbi:hypothetical protein [Acetobacter malorum]|uniref:hypothetical protein n=1 Tax=Acetobacter malorum TaxID=178901 RepID=UPI000AFCBA1B|nr:hypothetical protein [Acetobacter malorum]
MRDIVATLGHRLELPVRSIAPDETAAFFRQFAMFAGFDICASSALTRLVLGWEPTDPRLIADLEQLEVPD